MDLLQNQPVLWMSVAALLGLQFGSFLNVVVWRLPVMMQREWEAEVAQASGQAHEQAVFNLATPGSHCTSCMTPLRARDLVPLLSYLWLKGRCGHCRLCPLECMGRFFRQRLLELDDLLFCRAQLVGQGKNQFLLVHFASLGVLLRWGDITPSIHTVNTIKTIANGLPIAKN